MFNVKEAAALIQEAKTFLAEQRAEAAAAREFREVLRAKMKFEVEALLMMPGLRSEHKKDLGAILERLTKPMRP